MATATSTGNGKWSEAIWSGGSGSGGAPADGDAVTIAAGHSVLMDADLQSYTGLQTVTINGHATTPGMLYFKDGTNGYLKIRTGYNIVGTTGTCKGRLLVNSDGVWRGIRGTTITASASTNKISATAHGLLNNQAIAFYTLDGVLPAPLEMSKTYYIVNKGDNDFEVSLTSGGAAIDLTTDGSGTLYFNTVLAYTNKAVILMEGTSQCTATYLDISLNGYEPTTKMVRTYATAYQFTADTAVSVANDTIDLGTTPPATGTPVKVTVTASSLSVTGGTLPGGFDETSVYYVRSVSGNTCKLATQNADAQIVNITSTGSGTIVMYTGHTSTSTGTMNVLDNVTAVTGWVTTSGHNRVVLVDDTAPENVDQQRLTLAAINAGTIQLSANVNSAQYPGAKIVLVARNVSVRSSGTTAAQPIIDYSAATSAYGVFGCEIINTGGTGTTFYGYGLNRGTGHIVTGTVSGNSYGFNICTSCISTGTISGNSYGFISCTSCTSTGIVSGNNQGFNSCTSCTSTGTISGNNYGFNICTSCISTGTISGNSYGFISCTSCTSTGTVSGNTYGFSSCTSCTSTGTVSGNSQGFASCISCTSTGTVSGNYYGFNYSEVTSYNLTLSGNTTDYILTNQSQRICRSFKHGGVANDTRAWTCAGTMTHETTIVPTGKSFSHKFTYTSALFLNYMQWELSSPISSVISIPVYAKHDATGLTEAQRLHWQIIDPANDPMIDATKTALAEWIAIDSTDWQTSTLTYNKTDDKPLILRVSAIRGSGNAYCLADEISGGGGRPEFRGGNL